jgi:general secretion pathway protein D
VPLRFAVELRTNSIIATGPASELAIIEALLLRLDEKEARQRKTVVYRLKNSPARAVGEAVNEFLRSQRQIQQLAPGNISPFQQLESEVVVVPEPISNSLVLSATSRFFEEINNLIQKLDAQPPQVMIQVLIAQIELDNADEFGVELGLQDSVLFDRSLLSNLLTTTSSVSTPSGIITQQVVNTTGASNTPGFNFNATPLPPLGNSGSTSALGGAQNVGGQAVSNFGVGQTNSQLGFSGLVLSAGSQNVSVLLRALQMSQRMEVLSRPQVTTLDNQPAYIQIGQRVPRIVSSTLTALGQINSVTLENVGLILAVTPRISPDNTVVLEIDAEKSNLEPEATGIPISVSNTGTVIRSPIIDLTTAQTTVSATSGETIVLGGLITKNSSQMSRRVPWLADVPLLGSLFRYDSLIVQRTELLVIMTPYVIRKPQDAEAIKQKATAHMHWTCSDVHDIYGTGDLCKPGSCPKCDHDIPVIHPDLNPRGYVPTLVPDGASPRLEVPPMPTGPIEATPPVLVPPGSIMPGSIVPGSIMPGTILPGTVQPEPMVPVLPPGSPMSKRSPSPSSEKESVLYLPPRSSADPFEGQVLRPDVPTAAASGGAVQPASGTTSDSPNGQTQSARSKWANFWKPSSATPADTSNTRIVDFPSWWR